jgi:hypothetical protein
MKGSSTLAALSIRVLFDGETGLLILIGTSATQESYYNVMTLYYGEAAKPVRGEGGSCLVSFSKGGKSEERVERFPSHPGRVHGFMHGTMEVCPGSPLDAGLTDANRPAHYKSR